MKKIIRSLSSVRLAIVLIILLLAASIAGTLIPQGRDMAEYAARYGRMGEILVRLQFTNIFRSIWFMALMGVFGLNIIACTLTRLGPKVKRATRPRIESDPKELAGYKIKEKMRFSGGAEKAKERAVSALKEAHYKVRLSEESGEKEGGSGRIHVYGRKRIDGIFGSDVVHLGLLVIIAGGILTGFGGFRADVALNPGETKDVPKAGYAVRLDRFDTEMYSNGGIKDWKSTVTIIEDGKAGRSQVVEVNHPLVHKGFSLYQMAYGMNWNEATLELVVGNKSAGGTAGKTLKVKAGESVPLGDEAGTEIHVRQFIPDFILGENNQPESRSLELNNPAAYVEVRRGDKKIVEGWVFAAYPEFTRLKGDAAGEFSIELHDLTAPQYSVLQAAKDPGVPLIWLGCILVMGGLGLAFYRPTWEIRMVLTPTELTAAGIAVKSRDRFEAEFAQVTAGLRSSK